MTGILTLLFSLTLQAGPKLYVVAELSETKDTQRVYQLVEISWAMENECQIQYLNKAPANVFGHDHRLHLTRNLLVTSSGSAFDLASKTIIHQESDGRLVGIENNKVIFRVDNINRPSGIFCFDAATRKVTKLPDNNTWQLPGIHSSDRSQSVTSEGNSILMLHRIGQEPRAITDHCSVQLSPFSSFSPNTPVLWLDKNRLLTQEKNGELIMLDLDGKKEKVVSIPGLQPNLYSPTLRRWQDQQVIYHADDRDFLIHVQQKSYQPLEWINLGHDFSISARADAQGLRNICYQGKPVAKRRVSPGWSTTTNGLLACVEESEPHAEPKHRLLWVYHSSQRRFHYFHFTVRAIAVTDE